MPFRFELIRGWEPFGRYRRAQRFLEFFIPNFRPSASIFLDEIARLVAGDIRWIDVGCGSNWLIDHYREGAHGVAVGIDLLIPGNLTKRNRFIRADGIKLPFADRSFDLVTTTSVVEHLKYPHRFLLEMKRILKPTGALVIRTPNLLSPLVSVSRLFPEKLKRFLIRNIYHQNLELFPTYFITASTRHRDLLPSPSSTTSE